MGHREKFVIQAQTQLSSFPGSAIVFNGLAPELGITLKPVQEMEFEWYFRDHLFRSMNKGLSRLEISTIPKTLVDTYLKYRNANVDEISILLHSAIENLVQRDVINHGGTFIELKGKSQENNVANVSMFAMCLRTNHCRVLDALMMNYVIFQLKRLSQLIRIQGTRA